MKSSIGKVGLSIFLVCSSWQAKAESYPAGTLTIINPLAAGGAGDAVCRMVAEKLGKRLGVPAIVENRTGAGGSIGAEFVANAKPDGRTLLCAPEFIFTAHLTSKALRYDPESLEPVSLLITYPTTIVSRSGLPVQTLHDLVTLARSNPGKLTYASQGLGSMAHLTFEVLKTSLGLDIRHVPYRGGGPAMNDVVAGHVDLYAGTLGQTVPYLEANAVKLLALAGAERLAEYPSAPLLKDEVTNLAVDAWLSIAAPPGTPSPIIETLAASFSRAIQDADAEETLAKLKATAVGSTPAELRQRIRANTDLWRPLLQRAGLLVD